MHWTAFAPFFRRATGHDPYPYQQELAQAPALPEVLYAPTGAGKTAAAILGWLWRRRYHPDPEVRSATPRRLLYCLPVRVLVKQTRDNAQLWLQRLGLEGEVGLYLLMGGARDDEWLLYPEQEAVIVGTQDMLLSRALNRGYGLSRFRWPAAFGLASSDCLWVVDEVQLMGPGLATTAQLDALRRRLGTAGPAHTLWMSATLAPDWLATVDRPPPATILQMGAADRDHPDLGARLTADKRLYRADVGSVKGKAYPRRLAKWILRQHRQGTLTLVILNTVDRAQAVYRELGRLVRDGGPDLLLLHSRFRARERDQVLVNLGLRVLRPLLHSRPRVRERRQAKERLQADMPAAGRILVSTQVVEAGVDLSAHTLVTELAPWPSLVQRFGRCNRDGQADGARVFWIDVEDRAAAPYEPEEMARPRQVLREREGSLVSPAALPALDLRPPEGEVLRARDLIDLFDTAPDLSGQDVDVSRFIRDAQDLDVQVFWRRLEGAQPSAKELEPGQEELCPVAVYDLRRFLQARERRGWVWDHLEKRWRPLQPSELRPGLTVLLPAEAGGYDPALGWHPAVTQAVEPVPGPPGKPAEATGDDQSSFALTWQSLVEHTDAVVAEMEGLLQALPHLAPWAPALRTAARWHDAGKAHPEFQATLRRAGQPPVEGVIWAKAGGKPVRHRRPHFRHELASALALLLARPPLAPHLLDLAAYLAASYHGRVRLAIRSLPGEHVPDSGARYALGVWEGDPLLPADLGDGVALPDGLRLTNLWLMDLGCPAGGDRPWLERTLSLRDDPTLGPFRLAFLEACLQAADARASAAAEAQPGAGAYASATGGGKVTPHA